MDVGTEDDWLFANTEPEPDEDAEADGAELLRREMEAAAKRRGEAPAANEPEFHTEFKALLNKHGLEDFFYVVLSKDGAERGRLWGITAKPGEEGYTARAALLSFESTGLLHHLQGSTWM